ncbi:C40 family peptidase [Brevibacillus choshinensis]|uniref:C40 family peptidase n=1 Tax=Brevibacillus choshinensis TaxID=54911 RepID=UPI002E1E89B3|nr:C40 family peptidase [Brevibacillus choshinensis]
MTKRNWKGKTGTVVALLMGTSLLMGGQAYAASEKSHTSATHHSQHKHYKKHQKNHLKKDVKQANNQADQNVDEVQENQANNQFHDINHLEKSQNNKPTNDNNNTQNNQSKKDAAPLNLNTSIAKNADQATGAIAETSIPQTTKSLATTTFGSSSKTADQVIADGLKYKGVPYKFGSSKNTTNTFDCSSFTQRVFKQAGVNLPRDSRQQSKVGKQVSKNQLQKGDLIFFRSYGSSSSRITHVAIYAGNNTLLHTYGKGGVTTSKFAGTSWEKRFEIARRVI